MSWFGDHLWAFWLVLAVVLGAAEMTNLDLILLMLGIGCLGGVATAAVGLPFVVQFLVSAGLAVGMLGLVRPPIVRRLHGGPDLTLGHAKLVGTQGVVTTEISPHVTGRVTLRGETWSASPYDPDLTIPAGATVEVLEIRGATAFVHPLPELGI